MQGEAMLARLLLLLILCGIFLGAEACHAQSGPGSASPPGAQHSNSFTKNEALLTAVTIFVLAIFVGYEVIGKVPTTLHTPLMSGSNAISGITVVGAIIIGGFALDAFSSFVGFLAIVLATINVVGGFLVTHRMLAMFKRR
jgi:NAD(P) transhydrogenase subunit alpha